MSTPRTKPRSVSSTRGVVASGAGVAGLLMCRPLSFLSFVIAARHEGREQAALHTASTSAPPSLTRCGHSRPALSTFGSAFYKCAIRQTAHCSITHRLCVMQDLLQRIDLDYYRAAQLLIARAEIE